MSMASDQAVAHPELHVGLDGIAAAGVGHPLFRVAGGQRALDSAYS